MASYVPDSSAEVGHFETETDTLFLPHSTLSQSSGIQPLPRGAMAAPVAHRPVS